MHISYPVLTLPLTISALISVSVALLVLSRRNVKGGITLALLFLQLSAWAGLSAVMWSLPSLQWQVFCLMLVHSVVLANLVLGVNAFPEFIQEDCTPVKLSAALAPLLKDTPERASQLAALAKIREKMFLPEGTPSGKAAEIVLSTLSDDKSAARAAA